MWPRAWDADGENKLDSGYVLRVESTAFVDNGCRGGGRRMGKKRGEVRRKRRRRGTDDSKVWGC